MKKTILSIFLFCTIIIVDAQNGHDLWLSPTNHAPVNVVSLKKSATLNIAVQELQKGWQGQPGATITLSIKKDKAIKERLFKRCCMSAKLYAVLKQRQ